MLVKCEKQIDELTVQVWLLYYNQNFKYCNLYVGGTKLRTNTWTGRWTIQDSLDEVQSRCSWRTIQADGIKVELRCH